LARFWHWSSFSLFTGFPCCVFPPSPPFLPSNICLLSPLNLSIFPLFPGVRLPKDPFLFTLVNHSVFPFPWPPVGRVFSFFSCYLFFLYSLWGPSGPPSLPQVQVSPFETNGFCFFLYDPFSLYCSFGMPRFSRDDVCPSESEVGPCLVFPPVCPCSWPQSMVISFFSYFCFAFLDARSL